MKTNTSSSHSSATVSASASAHPFSPSADGNDRSSAAALPAAVARYLEAKPAPSHGRAHARANGHGSHSHSHADAATRAQAQITSALRLLPTHAHAVPRVLQVSALKADGIAPLWDAIVAQRDARVANGSWAAKRREQSLAWMWERIQAGLRHAFVNHPGMAARLEAATAEVRDGRTPASTAARQLLAAFQTRST